MPLDPSWLDATFPDLEDITALSEGGQKWVYVADHPEHGRVILKVYHPGSDPNRAAREVRSSRVVKHDLVPASLAIDDAPSPLGTVVWVIEEYIEGTTLRELHSVRRPQDREILIWADNLLDILAVAEENDIVHRDVKPANIIIDSSGNAWLLDFGLARHLDLTSITATEASRGVGTPGYSPREQFMNLKEQIDGRSDLFGLGVTLYECVEGTNPYVAGASNKNEVYRRVRELDLDPIGRTLTDDGSFRDMVAAMSQRFQEHRPPTVEFARDWMKEILGRAIG